MLGRPMRRIVAPLRAEGELGRTYNTLKTIKQSAYGYRDNAIFFLKIKAAFPGNP